MSPGKPIIFDGFVFSRLWHDPVRQRSEAAPASVAGTVAVPPLDVRNLVLASIGTAVLLVGQMVLITYVPLYLKESLGVTAFWASQALAVLQAGAICGRIGWGIASDRLFCRSHRIISVCLANTCGGDCVCCFGICCFSEGVASRPIERTESATNSNSIRQLTPKKVGYPHRCHAV